LAGAELRTLPNVHFLSRHKCCWGDFGHVRASLKGLGAIFEQRCPFGYAILLTGADYPIRSNAQTRTLLADLGEKSFLSNFLLPTERWRNGGMDRLESWHLHVANFDIVIPANPKYDCRMASRRVVLGPSLPIKRRVYGGLTPYGGSSYWSLSRECVEYIRGFLRRNPAYVRFFEHVNLADGLFFHTILMNSPLRDRLVNRSSTYMNWTRPWVPLGRGDLETLTNCSHLFARKFDVRRDAEILDILDERLLA
jgi:Core-2/I-Branching enzyme